MSRADVFRDGNVAVITGAALGIGSALACELAARGLSVVMADLESNDFDAAVSAAGAAARHGPKSVAGVATDVSNFKQVENLKDATIKAFGKVDLLANNAVTRIGRGIDADIAEWRRTVDVNLWGPIHGVRAFQSHLLENQSPTAIVNVGSKQGITNPPGHPVYNLTKSALKTYTEALQHELRTRDDNQGEGRLTAHLLVPGWTTTGKAEHKAGAWRPAQVVEMLLAGIADDDFYIVCPDGETTADMDRRRILWAAGDIVENRPPLSRWHPDFAELSKKECS